MVSSTFSSSLPVQSAFDMALRDRRPVCESAAVGHRFDKIHLDISDMFADPYFRQIRIPSHDGLNDTDVFFVRFCNSAGHCYGAGAKHLNSVGQSFHETDQVAVLAGGYKGLMKLPVGIEIAAVAVAL